MKVLTSLTLMLSALAFSAEKPTIDNTQLFIKLKENVTMPQSLLIKKSTYLFNNNYLVKTTNANELARQLKNNADVISTEKNYYAGARILPKVTPIKQNELPKGDYSAFNDPKVNRIWLFEDDNKNGVSVNKTYLSPFQLNKEEIIVAVVDTGVDYNHEDLASVMWINHGEIPNNGIDDDQNGYVDDIHGINTLVRNENADATGDPMASHAHGTHVSGTIGAAQNNYVGIAGIASKVKIMAIRSVPDNADETDADIVESFLYAAKNGAKLINCSFGKNHNEGGMIVNETINHIGSQFGTLVVAAAGNDYGRDIDSDQTFPASFESEYLLAVASTNDRGGLSWFSNIGAKSVDVAAPGSNIYSTTPNNSYGNMSGTSMATPTTVGVAAEVLSHFPTLGPIELKKLLMDSVTPIAKFKGKIASGGRIDLFKALTKASIQQR